MTIDRALMMMLGILLLLIAAQVVMLWRSLSGLVTYVMTVEEDVERVLEHAARAARREEERAAKRAETNRIIREAGERLGQADRGEA